MGKFLTSKSIIQQLHKQRQYRTVVNELYKDDDGAIYIVPRNYQTDNFTWINATAWDIRCAHLHDVGCQYHKIIKVKLSEWQLNNYGYLKNNGCDIICKDIPIDKLEVVEVSKKQINDLFYRMLRDSGAPKYIQILYRTGVILNVKWYLDKDELVLEDIYKRKEIVMACKGKKGRK